MQGVAAACRWPTLKDEVALATLLSAAPAEPAAALREGLSATAIAACAGAATCAPMVRGRFAVAGRDRLWAAAY